MGNGMVAAAGRLMGAWRSRRWRRRLRRDLVRTHMEMLRSSGRDFDEEAARWKAERDLASAEAAVREAIGHTIPHGLMPPGEHHRGAETQRSGDLRSEI